MVYIWLGLLVLFLIVEAHTMALTSVWFAAGSLLALVAAAFSLDLWVQGAVFVLGSVVLLIFTRPILAKVFRANREATNYDRILGQNAVVTEPIDNAEAKGQIKVAGQIWSARSEGGEPIAAGQAVTVTRIEGVKAFVKQE